MKERVLLLLSSIFMTIFLIFALTFDLMTEGDFPLYAIILYSLYILGTVIFYYYAFSKKNINRFLGYLISFILFLGNIVSGILGFVYMLKTNTYKKRELPKLEILHEYPTIVYILVFIVSMVLLFIIPLFVDNKILKYIFEVFIILTLIIIFRKDLKRDFKSFKEYFREYSTVVYKYYFICLAIYWITFIAVKLYTGITTATNQAELNEAFASKPLFVTFMALVSAPFMEELLFRGIFRKVFNNKYLFIISSGLVFGILHVIDDFKSPKELLYILVYSILGFFMAGVYHKTNNIFTNMLFHFTQNALAILAMVLTTFILK